MLLSIVGSLCSSFTLIEGWGEIYPFANWKLFTQPRGSNRQYSTYRIYTRQPGNAYFRRQPVQETATFDRDDYVYILETLVNQTLADTAHQTNSRTKLEALVRHLHPEAQEYRIVRESARLENLLHHPSRYEADTVAYF
ncbi:MAG: hypothetical protein ACO1OQ_08530 [Rufibacter sp.]